MAVDTVIENNIQWKKNDRQNWEKALTLLESQVSLGNKRFEQKLEDLRDFVKARIWEIKI